MLTLDQVRALEERVEKAVTAIGRLRGENSDLRDELARRQGRIAELEAFIDTVKRDQSRIEEAIVKALDRLEDFEDVITGKAPTGEAPSVAAKGNPKSPPATPNVPAPAVAKPEPEVPEHDDDPDVELELTQEPPEKNVRGSGDLGIF
ncbi:MAG: cell division protein ZapB [Spirochaetes bacterium]|nr:cell division protein ZapB [Spirochaetota bacterium]